MAINVNSVQLMLNMMSHGYDIKIATLTKIKDMNVLVIKTSTEVKDDGNEHVYSELVLTYENNRILLLELTNIIKSNIREDVVAPYSNDVNFKILDQVDAEDVEAVYVDIRTCKIITLNRLDYWFLSKSYSKLSEHDKSIPSILEFQD